MDILELGAIGELVGGVAVIGSLLYVGLQVRQSNYQSAQRTEVERNESEFARDSTTVVFALTNPNLSNVFRRGLNDLRALDRDEQDALAAKTPAATEVGWFGSDSDRVEA